MSAKIRVIDNHTKAVNAQIQMAAEITEVINIAKEEGMTDDAIIAVNMPSININWVVNHTETEIEI